MAKTAFVTDDGIYCYTKMPFMLKNDGADFQEGINIKAFEGLIRIIMEDYVDIIIKSKESYNCERFKASARQDFQN